MRFLKLTMAAASLVGFTSVGFSQGVITWDGLCEPATFYVAGVDCSTGCSLKKQVNGQTSTVWNFDGVTKFAQAVVDSEASSWFVEKDGVAKTPILQINRTTDCQNN